MDAFLPAEVGNAGLAPQALEDDRIFSSAVDLRRALRLMSRIIDSGEAPFCPVIHLS
jgi:hypothetical protein